MASPSPELNKDHIPPVVSSFLKENIPSTEIIDSLKSPSTGKTIPHKDEVKSTKGQGVFVVGHGTSGSPASVPVGTGNRVHLYTSPGRNIAVMALPHILSGEAQATESESNSIPNFELAPFTAAQISLIEKISGKIKETIVVGGSQLPSRIRLCTGTCKTSHDCDGLLAKYSDIYLIMCRGDTGSTVDYPGMKAAEVFKFSSEVRDIFERTFTEEKNVRQELSVLTDGARNKYLLASAELNSWYAGEIAGTYYPLVRKSYTEFRKILGIIPTDHHVRSITEFSEAVLILLMQWNTAHISAVRDLVGKAAEEAEEQTEEVETDPAPEQVTAIVSNLRSLAGVIQQIGKQLPPS
ncbi:hypothetical protein [Streptomyces sp. NPDC047028]|uniref:hypothetical protein n=1 Tax=Streptomyces sp. NPDC047028 TaxID=3155793 RepID=UPI0033F2C80A